jgi:hypothetical protein
MKENVKEITCVKFCASMSSGYLVAQAYTPARAGILVHGYS